VPRNILMLLHFMLNNWLQRIRRLFADIAKAFQRTLRD
jgi:hypothetical protein